MHTFGFQFPLQNIKGVSRCWAAFVQVAGKDGGVRTTYVGPRPSGAAASQLTPEPQRTESLPGVYPRSPALLWYHGCVCVERMLHVLHTMLRDAPSCLSPHLHRPEGV